MASLRQRTGPAGRRVWQVRIKKAGHPEMTGTFDLKTDAQRWAKQIESEMERGIFVSRAEAEATALERYAQEIAPHKKDRYHDTLRCQRLSKRPLARRSLASIKGADIAAFIRERQAGGLGANTIRLDLALLSHVFTVAVSAWGMESLGNPVQRVKGQRPKLPQGRDRRLVGDELSRLLSAAATYGGEIGPIITWAIATAMRRGEIAGMRWEHHDRKARVLLMPETKNGTPRRVPLSTAALAVLDALPRRLDGRVWGMRPDSISQAFERVCKAAGVEGLTFHACAMRPRPGSLRRAWRSCR